MSKLLFIPLLFALAAYGQQERIAIMHTVDDGDSINVMNLGYLTDRLRDIGAQVLPKNRYGIMTQQSIVDRLGSQERAEKECREATCIADLGRKINADYIAQGRIGRFSGKLTIKVELYKVSNSNLLASLTGDSDDLKGLLAVLNEKAPDIFKKMPGVSDGRVGPFVAGGISGLESGTDYVLDYEKHYLASFATEPPGAILSFNGVPAASCLKTPCSVELAEGGVRVIAVLDQHETADTVVLIKQNGQSINIRLKSSFGVLEVKPAYLEGIGRNEAWNFAINGKLVSSWENRLSPGKYNVKLSHRCYEDISFDAGINKDKREVFEMGSHVKPKLGGLVLSAEKDDKPVSEPVFVDGKQVGETPFSGSVHVCSDIKVGEEKVAVKLEYKQTVRHVHKVGFAVTSEPVAKKDCEKTFNMNELVLKVEKEFPKLLKDCSAALAKNIALAASPFGKKTELKEPKAFMMECAIEGIKQKLPLGSEEYVRPVEGFLQNFLEASSAGGSLDVKKLSGAIGGMDMVGLLGGIRKLAAEDDCAVDEPYEPSVAAGGEAGGAEGKESKRRWSLGLRAGWNASHLYAEYENSYTSASGTYGSSDGLQVGLLFDWALNDWFHLQPGIMYFQKVVEDKEKTYYIEIPLLLSLKFSALRINAGPYFGIRVFERSLDVINHASLFDFGLSTGFGFDIWKLYIGVFYDYGLAEAYGYNYHEKGNNININHSLKGYNRTLGFNLGVNL